MQCSLDDLSLYGFAIIPRVVNGDTVDHLVRGLDSLPNLIGVTRRRKQQPFARRNLLDLADIRALADSPPLRSIVEPVLGHEASPVRGILFDKTPGANWLVPWHQDLSIAVRRRIDVPGFGPWSEKAGVVHVQPPVSVLQRMLTIRLHLDDCDVTNGPLIVIPGSHGRLHPPNELRSRVAAGPKIECTVARGGAIVMYPMLLHTSSPAKVAGHRRVIHIEYAASKLPGGLEWYVDAQSLRAAYRIAIGAAG
jgi:hypothetical protein